MVIGDRLPWKFILRLHAPWLGATAAVAIIAFALRHYLQLKIPVTPVPFQIAGVALALPVLLGLSLAFLVLETLGRILEDPFTVNPNALALNAICRNIEINLRQQLGETELPAAIVPDQFGNVPVLL